MNLFDRQVETSLFDLLRPYVSRLRSRGRWLAAPLVIALVVAPLGLSTASASDFVTESTPGPKFVVTATAPDSVAAEGGTQVLVVGENLDVVEQVVFDGQEIADTVISGSTTLAFTSLTVTSGAVLVPVELAAGETRYAFELAVDAFDAPVLSSEPDIAPGEESLGFIVKYKDLASLPGALSSAEVVSDEPVSLALGEDLGEGMRKVDVGAGMDAASAEDVLQSLENDPRIEWVQPVRRTAVMGPAFPDAPPNDPDYDQQWGLWDSFGIGMGTLTTSVSPAWGLSSGSGIVVAVLDTGITDHEDLPASQLVAGYDFVDGQPEQATRNFAYGSGTGSAIVDFDGDYINTGLYGSVGWDNNPLDPGDWGDPDSPSGISSSWHGTRVAGLVGAKTDNGLGIAAVAPSVEVQPVRVLSWLGGTDADLAAAITWASGGAVSGVSTNATPADVINMSLGGLGACDPALQTAIDGAIGRGVAVVAAAGNLISGGQDALGVFPANCEGVIVAGATGSNGERSYYSNYGSTVDLAAPGTAYSTTNLGTYTPTSTTNAVSSASGTSFSAPLVSGVAALLKSMDSTLSPEDVGALMTGSVRSFAGANCDPINTYKTCGSGILDASRATIALDNSLSALVVSSTSLSPTFSRVGSSYAASVANGVSQVSITPTQSFAGGSLTVDGTSATSGVASSVDLVVGSNVVDVVSVGPGGYGSVTYSVTITRAGATPPTPPAPSPDGGGGSSESPSETTVAALAVSGFLPTSGSTAGGTLVTVYGSGLSAVTRVLFGNADAQIVRVINDSAVQVLTPPGSAGSYSVSVVVGGSTLNALGTYTFVTPVPLPEDRIRIVNSTGGVERVVVVSGEAPYRPTVTIKRGTGRTVSSAPKVNVGVGVIVTPRVKGLPKSKKFGVAMLVPGADPGTQRMFMGTVRTNKYGVTILPAARATEAGKYTYRLTRKKSGSYYVQLRARP